MYEAITNSCCSAKEHYIAVADPGGCSLGQPTPQTSVAPR